MSLPGLANVFGIGAALLYHALDPRKKKEKLLDAKERILKSDYSPARADKLMLIESELLKVEREIERRVS